jgi:DNA mismatch endonuclease (patch repair protein)
MAKRRPQDTSPEVALRRQLHARGLRFARHGRDLPGPPDIVLPKRRTAVFVRGCFWHGHDCPQGRAAPQFHVGAWAQKIEANQSQHDRDGTALGAAGWQVETVWECEVDQPAVIDALAARLLMR